jgi:hypothetical protein
MSRDTGTLSTTFIYTGAPRGEYLVRVRGINAAGLGEPSNLVRILVTQDR